MAPTTWDGMMGFGRVIAETDEPVFHAPWERRAFALTLTMGGPGGWNINQARAARESLHPAEYLAKTYYEIWIAGLEVDGRAGSRRVRRDRSW
jgi:nitrile hydratase subunit beta